MSTVTWNPELYPQAGDVLGWDAGNLAGRRIVVKREGDYVFFRKEFPGVPAVQLARYNRLERNPSHVYSVRRASWRAWCRRDRPYLLAGGKRDEDSYEELQQKLDVAMQLLGNISVERFWLLHAPRHLDNAMKEILSAKPGTGVLRSWIDSTTGVKITVTDTDALQCRYDL